jgi:uncharacterized protein
MSMLLDLSRYRGGVERIERRDDPSAFDLTDDQFRLVGPVSFVAEVQKDARKVRLVGRTVATLELTCGRCLESFQVPVDSSFDLLFLPATEAVGGADEEIDAADVGVSFYHDDVIDLADVIREQLYLALPMKPLCREDCLGLCPVCGQNRNTTPCTCKTEWVDPRMDALRNLKKDS